MNAAVLAHGWIEGEAAGARAALDAYWDRVATAAAFSPLQRTPLDRLFGRSSLDNSPVFIAFDLISRVFSPYDLNPRGFNPLTPILRESIAFERLAEIAHQVVHHGNKRSHRPRPHISKRRSNAGCLTGLGVLANHVPSHRDRRGTVLGWRLRW